MSPETAKARALYEAAECFGAAELIDILVDRQERTGEIVQALLIIRRSLVGTPAERIMEGDASSNEASLLDLLVQDVAAVLALEEKVITEFDMSCSAIARIIRELGDTPPSGAFTVPKGPTRLN